MLYPRILNAAANAAKTSPLKALQPDAEALETNRMAKESPISTFSRLSYKLRQMQEQLDAERHQVLDSLFTNTPLLGGSETLLKAQPRYFSVETEESLTPPPIPQHPLAPPPLSPDTTSKRDLNPQKKWRFRVNAPTSSSMGQASSTSLQATQRAEAQKNAATQILKDAGGSTSPKIQTLKPLGEALNTSSLLIAKPTAEQKPHPISKPTATLPNKPVAPTTTEDTTTWTQRLANWARGKDVPMEFPPPSCNNVADSNHPSTTHGGCNPAESTESSFASPSCRRRQPRQQEPKREQNNPNT